MEDFEFNIYNQMAVTDIAISLVDGAHRDLSEQWFSLSGFPRCIPTEDSRRRKRKYTSRHCHEVC